MGFKGPQHVPRSYLKPYKNRCTSAAKIQGTAGRAAPLGLSLGYSSQAFRAFFSRGPGLRDALPTLLGDPEGPTFCDGFCGN